MGRPVQQLVSALQLQQEAEANPATIHEEQEEDWLVGAHPSNKQPARQPARPAEGSPRRPTQQPPLDADALLRGGRTVSLDKGWKMDEPGPVANRCEDWADDDVTSAGAGMVRFL